MNHYINDRTEAFDDYFPCTKAGCKLQHITDWLNLFVNLHNKKLKKGMWLNEQRP